MSKRLLSLIALLLLPLLVGQVSGQQETAAGTLLFQDTGLPMPAGPGQVSFFKTDSNIPGDPIELFVGDVQTRELARALPGHNFREDANLACAWSPDGSQFIIPGKKDGGWELFLYDRGDRSGKLLTDLAKYRVEVTEEERAQLNISPDMQLSIGQVKYSPSGKRIIFTLKRLAKTAVWWHDLETGVTRQATEDRTGYSGCFDPDDDHFYYAATVRKGGDIHADEDIIRRSISSGVADTIVSTEAFEYNPDVSPDGKYLLFTKRVDNVNNIYVMKLGTGETRQLTSARAGQNCSAACWSATGKNIYVHGAGFLSKPAIFLKEFDPF